MESYGPVMLRLVTGAIVATHGAQALSGAPSDALAVLAAAVACAGGLLLVTGALTGYASAALIVLVLGSLWNASPVNAVFAGADAAARHGLELHLLVLAALLSVLLTGPGALSIDNRRRRSAEAYAAGRARLRSRL